MHTIDHMTGSPTVCPPGVHFVAHFLGESQQEVASVNREHLNGNWLEQIPAFVHLTDLLVHKLEASVNR